MKISNSSVSMYSKSSQVEIYTKEESGDILIYCSNFS
jgi:hypothetical protein